MQSLSERCLQAFAISRKLRMIRPTAAQLANVQMRLRQIFTEPELVQLDEQGLTRQVERVWPIAQYVDQPD